MKSEIKDDPAGKWVVLIPETSEESDALDLIEENRVGVRCVPEWPPLTICVSHEVHGKKT